MRWYRYGQKNKGLINYYIIHTFDVKENFVHFLSLQLASTRALAEHGGCAVNLLEADNLFDTTIRYGLYWMLIPTKDSGFVRTTGSFPIATKHVLITASGRALI